MRRRKEAYASSSALSPPVFFLAFLLFSRGCGGAHGQIACGGLSCGAIYVGTEHPFPASRWKELVDVAMESWGLPPEHDLGAKV